MVLENIESNIKLDDKPPSKDKAKGADSKRKAESNDHTTPKRPRKAALRSTVLSARNMQMCIPCTIQKSAKATTWTDARRRQEGCPNPTNQQVRRMG